MLRGQGQSDATPQKQEDLQKILEQLMSVVKRIWVKKSSRYTSTYYYIDTNAGCGTNKIVQCDGSPLVFLRAARKLAVPYQAYFVDIEPRFTQKLNDLIYEWPNCRVITGDNRVVLPKIVAQLPKKETFGCVYMDTNGIPDFGLLATVCMLPDMNKIDLLIRYGAMSLKRNFHQGYAHLITYLTCINKGHWYVKEPVGRQQWTFLLGMNWADMHVMKGLGWCKARSTRGKQIVEKLNYTNKELEPYEQLPLIGGE